MILPTASPAGRPGTSATDLLGLAGAGVGPVSVLPAGDPVGAALARPPAAGTAAAVAAAGLSCGG